MGNYFKKFNKTKKFDFDTKGLEYFSLQELYEELTESNDGKEPDLESNPIPVRAIYINTKGYYDPAPVVGIDGALINLPAHLLESAEDIINDEQAVKLVNQGHCGMVISYYWMEKYNKTCYTAEFVEI